MRQAGKLMAKFVMMPQAWPPVRSTKVAMQTISDSAINSIKQTKRLIL